jgi:hypothetical protein
VAFRYTEEEAPVGHVLTYNDFAYLDHSLTSRTPLKVFQAFEPSVEDSPTLYLAFANAFPNDPARLYFQMSERVSLEEDRRHREYLSDYYAERDRALAAEQRVVWEFWNGLQWIDLAPQDETRAFTESGFVRFVGPEDWKPSRRFGTVGHWLRVRLEMGGYHQMPRITHILLNAVYAHNHTTIREETLGSSDGTPNQTFRFARTPLIEGQRIMVREKQAPEGDERLAIVTTHGDDAIQESRRGGFVVRWTEVDSFYESGPRSRHYVIDRLRGEVKFGDGRKRHDPPGGHRRHHRRALPHRWWGPRQRHRRHDRRHAPLHRPHRLGLQPLPRGGGQRPGERRRSQGAWPPRHQEPQPRRHRRRLRVAHPPGLQRHRPRQVPQHHRPRRRGLGGGGAQATTSASSTSPPSRSPRPNC